MDVEKLVFTVNAQGLVEVSLQRVPDRLVVTITYGTLCAAQLPHQQVVEPVVSICAEYFAVTDLADLKHQPVPFSIGMDHCS